jgi:hypothetical protein
MKDKFGRELSIGDICFRIKTASSRFGKASAVIVSVLDFTESKVKIKDRSFVDSTNLIKASSEGLETYVYKPNI